MEKEFKPGSVKEQYNGGQPATEETATEQKKQMTREETMVFYQENLPFMRLDDEYNELAYKFNERRVKMLELEVRNIEALGYLTNWKAGQEAARKAQEEGVIVEGMKKEWDAMSDEEKAEMTQKAKENVEAIKKQAEEVAK